LRGKRASFPILGGVELKLGAEKDRTARAVQAKLKLVPEAGKGKKGKAPEDGRDARDAPRPRPMLESYDQQAYAEAFGAVQGNALQDDLPKFPVPVLLTNGTEFCFMMCEVPGGATGLLVTVSLCMSWENVAARELICRGIKWFFDTVESNARIASGYLERHAPLARGPASGAGPSGAGGGNPPPDSKDDKGKGPKGKEPKDKGKGRGLDTKGPILLLAASSHFLLTGCSRRDQARRQS
jgi:hypothetical protein